MSTAYKNFSTRRTPQSQPIPGETMVRNNAGGFVYALTPLKQLERFLILGSEGGTYYVGEKALTADNAKNIIKAIETSGKEAVDLIVQVSDEGRAPKNDPAIFALAIAAAAKDADTRAYALSNLGKVCRIPTHLFHFVTYVQNMRGWGRALKREVGNWYQNLPVDKLAYEVVKYQSRDGFSNRDVLRLTHPKTKDEVRNAIYNWIVKGDAKGQCPTIIHAFEAAKNTKDTKELIKLIEKHNLSREMLPTEALNKPEVWEALLEKMPLTALVRNLGTMGKVGLLKPLSAASKLVCQKLADEGQIKKARLHPLNLLIAQRTYASGRGHLGSNTWTTVPQVVAALEGAFYSAFKYLEPTNKNYVLGVDVSGSMGMGMGKLPISCCEGAAAMAMAIIRTEPNAYIHGFTDRFVDLGITSNDTLASATRKAQKNNFGSTDASVPPRWAREKQIDADVFITITDNDTWSGQTHASQELRAFREKMNKPNAASIVVGMTATNFTIADPKDLRSLDVVGFDTSVPALIAEFVRG